MDAVELLKRMAETYKAANTYWDYARIVKARITGSEREEGRAKLTTYFVRPSHFRLDYQIEPNDNPWPRHNFVIWRNGGDTKVLKRSEILTVSHRQCFLEVALLEHFGSIAIPGLLMPGEFRGGGMLAEIQHPTLEGEEALNSHPCYVVTGKSVNPRNRKISLWLDTTEFLVRRMREWYHNDFAKIEREGVIRDAHLKAAGIPSELRPAYKKVRSSEDHDTEIITDFETRINGTVDLSHFAIADARKLTYSGR